MQSNLEQGCLHFSDVNSFNDASEFSYAISNDHSLLTNEEKRSVKFFFDFLRNDMEKSGKKVPYTMHSVFHDLEFELGMDKKLIKSNESLKALMFFSTEYMIEGLRSLCLTKNVKSIPMWGYYGDGMKGVCLGFDIDDGSLMQVKYYKENEKLPEVCAENIVNFATSERYDYIKRIVSCKSSGWKHEEEFRWIDHSYNLARISHSTSASTALRL